MPITIYEQSMLPILSHSIHTHISIILEFISRPEFECIQCSYSLSINIIECYSWFELLDMKDWDNLTRAVIMSQGEWDIQTLIATQGYSKLENLSIGCTLPISRPSKRK